MRPKIQHTSRANACARAFVARVYKAGCIWDDYLKKWMDLESLLKHPDPAV